MKLTDEYLGDRTKSKAALEMAMLDEPTYNAYHHRIWRAAIMLALVGMDHFYYQTSHTHSTVWATRGGQASARVFDSHINIIDGKTEYNITMSRLDGLEWGVWLDAHHDITEEVR